MKTIVDEIMSWDRLTEDRLRAIARDIADRLQPSPVVICDTSNNTRETIARGELIADIYWMDPLEVSVFRAP